MQKFNFVEGINKDVDVRYLKPTQYRDALNVRINDAVGGNELSLTNLKGNTKADYTLPDGKNTVIGSYEDVTSQSIFYFIFNLRNSHQIVKYDYYNNVFTQLVEGIGLRFEEDKKIKDVTFIGNRYLDWAQEGYELGSVDIQKTYPTILDSNRFLVEKAKQPHQAIVSADYTIDTDFNDNNLRGNLWQFAVVYVYDDNTRSNISSRSIVPTPSSDNIIAYGGTVPITTDNQINVQVSTGEDNVKTVELLARRISAVGVAGDWFVTDSVDKDDDTDPTITFAFKNNSYLRPANITDTNQIGNFFPKNPKNLVFGYDKRQFMYNFIDGFEQVTVNGSLDWVYNPYPSGSSSLSLTFSAPTDETADVKKFSTTATNPRFVARTAEAREGSTPSVVIGGDVADADLTVPLKRRLVTLNGTQQAGDLIIISADITNYRYFEQNDTLQPVTPFTLNYSIEIEYRVTATDANDINTLAINLANAINSVNTRSVNSIGGFIARKPSSVANNELEIWYGIGSDINSSGAFALSDVTSISATVGAAIGESPQINFKRGVEHEFAIAYEDEKGRLSTAYTSNDWKSSPIISTSLDISDSQRGAVNVKLNFDHKAPEGAVHYHILHRIVKSRYLQFIGELAVGVGANEYEISLDDLTDYNTEYESSNLSYEFVKGDKIRLLRISTGTIIQPTTSGVSVLQEVEINSYDTTNNIVKFILDETTSPALVGGQTYLFEIRGASPEQNNNVFFETGINYPVNSSLNHESGDINDDQNQTSTQPAIVNINTYGDSYVRNRVFDASTELFVEDDGVSDFYENTVNPYGIGRPNQVDERVEQQNRISTGAYTEPFIDNSLINGTATVYDASIRDYTEQYGEINKAYSDGRRQYLFFERKVGAVGINQANTLNTANGVIYDTSTVLTDIQFFDWEVGIGNAGESFTEQKGVMYWHDNYRGAVCKFAQNGLQQLQLRGLSGDLTRLVSDTLNNSFKCLKTFYNTQYEEVGFLINNDQIVTEDDITTKTADTNSLLAIDIPSTFLQGIADGDTVTIYQIEQGGGAPTYFETEATVVNPLISNGVLSVGFSYATERPEAREGFNWSIEQIELKKRETYIYSEASVPTPEGMKKINAWLTRTSQNGEWAEFKNINMVTFKDGELWIEESNETRNNFYGTQYNSELQIVANENPSTPKRFKTIQQESNKLFTVPLIQTNTPSGANKSLLQESNLVANNFDTRSNMFVAGFYKDINTVNISMPRYNGNDLRGQYAIVDLQNQDTEEVILFSLGINYITTETSNSD